MTVYAFTAFTALVVSGMAVAGVARTESSYADTTATVAAADPQPQPAQDDNIHRVRWEIGQPISGRATADDYQRMITGVRRAAGHPWRLNMWQTTNDQNRLVAVEVYIHNLRFLQPHRLNLYFTADDLYFRGWETPDDDTHYVWQIGGYDLARRLGPHRIGVRANFQENYAGNRGIEATAGLTRRTAHFSRNSLLESLTDLRTLLVGHTGTQRQAARASLRLIVAIAEAARFGGIAGAIGEALRHDRATQLDDVNVALTNQWATLSDWGIRESNDTTTPPIGFGPNIPLPVINNIRELEHFVFMIKHR